MYVLKLDHDPRCPRLTLLEIVKRLRRANRKLVAMGERRSPSGRGWHRWVLVEPAPRSAVETVALQLLLGSDPYREAYLINRAVRVDGGGVAAYFRQNFNVLYRRP